MSRREDIDNAIWADPDFVALAPDAKLLYLWSFTNPFCGMSGLYKIPPTMLGFGTGLTPTRIKAALRELHNAGFLFYVDRVLWVRSRVKHLRSRSPQMAKSIANDLLKVAPDHELRVRFQQEYGSHPWLREEVQQTYKGTSKDPTETLSEKPIGKPDSDTLYETLSGTSPEVHGQGQGQGLTSSSSSSSPSLTSAAPTTEVRELALRLADHIRRNDPKAQPKPESDRWLTDMRLLVKDRGGDIAEVQRVIDSSQTDSFWRSNILSPAKLRKHFTRLVLKADNGDAEGVNPALPEWQRPRPEWLAQVKAHLEAQEA